MNDTRASFLKNAGWDQAEQSLVTGDLSTRRYTRLSMHGSKAILMECDPETDASLRAFVKMTRWLRDLGLSAPEILSLDASTGHALLEDFGDAKLTTLITNDPSCQKRNYNTILDVLVTIRNAPAPALKTPDARELAEATKLADEWYPGARTSLLDEFRVGLETVLREILNVPLTVSLRDFHADNIIWLDQRAPIQQPGLLDYQDAIITHPAYDLMSLITDARTDVSVDLRHEMIRAYAARAGGDPEALAQSVAVLGAQRNLRILGIFARAARADAKTHQLAALPRVYGYLMDCCEHSTLAPFSVDLREALPEPTPSLIRELAS
ncbi:MAG: phosphotransferase [Boseongicola sp.]|nr:phosphotransferase [Boseongicola sp.]